MDERSNAIFGAIVGLAVAGAFGILIILPLWFLAGLRFEAFFIGGLMTASIGGMAFGAVLPPKQASTACAIMCWGVAGAVASFAVAMLVVLAGWSFIQAAFAAALLAGVLGVLLTVATCRDLPKLSSGVAPRASAAQTGAAAASTAKAAPAPTAAHDKPAPAAQHSDTPAPQARAPETVVEPKPAPAPAASDEPDPETVGTRPAALDGPKAGGADDLKRIKGIGPKLEKLCNSLGFYHFDQIAAWTTDEVAWVDANLTGFKGRVTRDNWVEQAKLLATGAETEFSKKVDKGDVY